MPVIVPLTTGAFVVAAAAAGLGTTVVLGSIVSTSAVVLGVAIPFIASVVRDIWSAGGVDRLRTPVWRLIGMPPVGIRDYGGTILLAVFVFILVPAPVLVVPVVVELPEFPVPVVDVVLLIANFDILVEGLVITLFVFVFVFVLLVVEDPAAVPPVFNDIFFSSYTFSLGPVL